MDSGLNIPAPPSLNPQGQVHKEITPTDSGAGKASANLDFSKWSSRKAVVYAKVPVPQTDTGGQV